VSETPPDPDDLDLADELADLADETLHLEAVDPETGERISGFVRRDHLAQAMIERDQR
jgi:hypothetical protein